MKPILEIILTTRDESTETIRNFINSLNSQRGINFDRITLSVVASGLFPDFLLDSAPYGHTRNLVNVNTVSAARNAGISTAVCDWLMFCEPDDLFCGPYALKTILDVLPNNNYDMLWAPIYVEKPQRNADPTIIPVQENLQYIHGKIFSRSFLNIHGIRFCESVPVGLEQEHFLAVCSACTDHTRYGKISSDYVPYVHTYRPEGANHLQETNNLFSTYVALDFQVLRSLTAGDGVYFNDQKASERNLALLFADTYFLSRSSTPKITRELYDFLTGSLDAFLSITRYDLECAIHISHARLLNAITDRYNRFGQELTIEDVPSVSDVFTWAEKTFQRPKITQQDSPDHPERVVVYAGTRNVYDSMLTSCKSLLHHNDVDRVYFLIEDDTFPEPLPDCVTCLNVSQQRWFSKDGPNFRNAWTYMVLLRAAYPQILTQHKRILSLDVDTLVLGDISPLFTASLPSDAVIAGVPEIHKSDPDNGSTYINFGVVIMNLERMRQEHIDDALIRALNTTRYGFPEQDAFNSILSGRIGIIHSAYNQTPWAHITPESEPAIIHYAGMKYYKCFEQYRHFADMTWETVLCLERKG